MEFGHGITFCKKDLFSSAFTGFEEMRKTGELCDLQIKIENVSLIAHRVVLAAAIPYFRSVFSNLKTEETDIPFGDLNPAILEPIINFAYNGMIHINFENVYALLQASQVFLLDEVSDACFEFLSKSLHFSNVLEVYNLASNMNKLNLMESCILFMQENFEEFCRTDEFGSLSGSVVRDIISTDNLSVTNERIVAESILKWVKHSVSERHSILPELLAEIRMIYLPVDYLTGQFSSEEIIKESVDCWNLIDEVQNYDLTKNDNKCLSTKSEPRNYRMQPGIYAICKSIIATRCISLYSFVEDTWRHVTSWSYFITKRKDTIWHVVAVNGKLYMFLREITQIFELKTREQQQLETWHRGIHGAAVVPFGNLIYCFGSYDVDFEGTLGRFDTEENKWLSEERMRTARCHAAVAILEGSIYVTGGYSQGMYLNSVEKYNPLTREWTAVAPMITPRRRHGCVAANGKIYVFGGNSLNHDLRTGEVYDPVTNKWKFVSSMEMQRYLFSLVCHENEIYVVGGITKSGRLTEEVEIYEPESDRWRPGGNVPFVNMLAFSIPTPGN